ncbi:hypothetical protein HGB25_01895 [Candidatus Saccharibacteria bacterium]|nr:hypothetical protein [Candidatus Saccharibacteria bacterium]
MKGMFRKKSKDIPRRRAVVTSESAPRSGSDVFRRNRTLTGTTSNHLDAVGAHKNDLQSPRSHAHHLTAQRRKVSSVLMVVLVSVGFLWFLISNFTASAVVSVGDTSVSKPVDKAVYERVIQDYLIKNPMSRFTFFMDQTALRDYLSSKLPEVADVKQRGIAGIGRTTFVVTMRSPIAGWQINNRQYYVDASGMPFDKNYYRPPSVQIIDNSGVSLKSDATAIASRRFLSFVGRVVYLSKSNGYTVTQAILPSGTTRELEVHISGIGSYVKFSIDRPAGEQVEDMNRAILYFRGRGMSPKYIDVRVSGKAFFI